MGGTVAGGKKASVTNRRLYGEDWYRIIAAKGGQWKGPKGFAVSGKAREAGRLGGLISKRRKVI